MKVVCSIGALTVRPRRAFAALFFLGVFIVLPATSASAQISKSDSLLSTPDSLPAYSPITTEQRCTWFADSTVGPQSLAAGVLSASFGTAENKPKEYGGSWDGFAKRYGMRLTGISTGNAMEAGFGALWGEDPRHVRAAAKPFRGRVRNIVKLTFLASHRDGQPRFAYARFIAIPANNYLSNTWRADGEATAGDAALRTLWGILGRMGSNALMEFWPDVRSRLFHKKP